MNLMTGQGKITWPEVAVYEGQVVEAVRSGQGTLINLKSQAEYQGEWRDGHRHGQGTQYYDVEKKCFYQGEWHLSQRHGKGVMMYEAPDTFYQGTFMNDKKHGWVLRFALGRNGKRAE